MIAFLFVMSTLAPQGCPPCTPVFEVRDTLGSTADPAAPGPIAEVARVSADLFLVSAIEMGTDVLTYDGSGNLLGNIGRRGSGPGEIERPVGFSVGNGQVLIHEMSSPRVHVFGADLSFQQTHILQGPVWSASASRDGRWTVALTGPVRSDSIVSLQTFNADWELQESFGMLPYPPDVYQISKYLAVSSSGLVWTVNKTGFVEVLRPDLTKEATGQITGDDIGATPRRRAPPWEQPPTVSDVRLDDDGLFWVFFAGPDADFEPPSGSSQRPTPEEIFDTLIYFVRLVGNDIRIVGSARLDTFVRPLTDGWAFDMADMPDGDRKVRVGVLGLR